MYELHTLGWSSFQQLCHTILREILGQTVESFLESNDGGRDGAFTGSWKPAGNEDMAGRFVVQCKFTSRINRPLRASEITDEIEKAQRLVERRLCDCYVLMTNAGISGNQAAKIDSLLRSVGVKHVQLLGATWINQQIRENKRLRMLVPRLYGLGDLTQILDERVYAQGRAILESLRDDLATVVVTDAYRRAANALDKHGFVLLIGEPAAGKTTIATLLAMAAVDQWSASLLKLDYPEKVGEHWNPHEPSQLFWLDDAFGVTQYEQSLVHSWNRVLTKFIPMLRTGAKIVMTSRDYIYNRARIDLKEGAFPLLQESQVVIDVHDLSDYEKRQILYNHVKLGRQPQSFRRTIKPHLEDIAAHERFIPETARRLAEPLFTKNLRLNAYHLSQFVEKRERLLEEVLRGLDSHSKAGLALIFMHNGQLESPISLSESEEATLQRLGSTAGGCIAALESLRGSLVLHSNASGESIWQFKHPTIGDAYAAILAASPELLSIFVHGSSADRLVEQVTCGEVGIENAINIPKALFPTMLDKLVKFAVSNKYKSRALSTWSARTEVLRFLARRCSRAFLALYIEQNPELLEEVAHPGLYLSAVPEVDLAVRLHEFNLLPEDKRRAFVESVSDYAVSGEDLYALDNIRIKSIFNDEEFEELLENVRSHLIPRLDEVRHEAQSNYNIGDSADAQMQPLLESFITLEQCFSEDVEILSLIDRETRMANEWIAENHTDEPSRAPRSLGALEARAQHRNSRSIFDDIDE